MDKAVIEYRRRRQNRLKKRMDDEQETNAPTNNKGSNKGGSRGHGNTRLPFGLCQKYGIEIGKGWQPRDAWDALAGKGVTPSGEYARLSSGKKQGVLTQWGGGKWQNLKAKSTGEDSADKYLLFGDKVGSDTGKGTQLEHFYSKDEMFSYLKGKGIKRINDPDTGEVVDLSKINPPKIVGGIESMGIRYKRMVLGQDTSTEGRKSLSDRSGRSVLLTGVDFGGKRYKLKSFKHPDEAKEYAKKKYGCDVGDLTKSKEYLKRFGDLD